jgi:hypothetical protein
MAKGSKPKPPYVPPPNMPIPTGLTGSAISSTEIELNWDSVPNAQGYWVYRTPAGGAEFVPAIVQVTTFIDGQYQASPLSPGTTYTYAIAAVVATVLGPKSNSVTITTPN